ncbi:MAG: serine/threonine protein kinase, bacterial [Solirubrobacterales bacterium]|nr:serine/threonine protein kinase, bacterial [Solirubrobacterales bacterium]
MGDPAIGSTLAGYRIESLIARGGMGVVYRATQLALDRPVALKVIARELADNEGFRERFLSESRLAASLDHPSVVPVYDAREDDGELIVAMRLVEGGDLRKLIDRDGPLEPGRTIHLLGQVAEALDAAHAAGIVHRDVKPHNVLVEGERAYLSDFGLAKAYAETGSGAGASIVGTVEYMAPEQWRGERVGPEADVYALGCVLYEALTGIVPYARKEADAEPEVPKGIDAVIERAVSKDPADRYRSAGELIDAAEEREDASLAATAVLSEAGGQPTVPIDRADSSRWRFGSRRVQWLGATVAVAAGVLILALALLGGDDVSVSDPVPIGKGPLRVAAGDGEVWATSASDGTLSKIDPKTLEVAGTRLRVGAGVSGVAVGAGAVWVSSPRDGRVLRVDPGSRRVLARIDVGGNPGAIAVGDGRVWVADEAGAGVTAINALNGKVDKRGIVPHAAPLRLAVGAGGLWVSSASTSAVRRIDLGSADAGEPILAGRGPAGVTVAGGFVWVANSRAGTVTRVDPSLRTILGDPIPVGGIPGGIDAGPETVWVANSADDTVTRIDIATAEPTGNPIAVGSHPGAVAVGADAVWVANNGDGTLTRIEP